MASGSVPPGPSDYLVTLTFGVQPRCYLTSKPGNESIDIDCLLHRRRKWHVAHLELIYFGPVGVAAVPSGSKVTAVAVSSLPSATPLPAGRPNVTLASDGTPGQPYKAGNYDCPDISNDANPDW